jgi:hypothetical protein
VVTGEAVLVGWAVGLVRDPEGAEQGGDLRAGRFRVAGGKDDPFGGGTGFDEGADGGGPVGMRVVAQAHAAAHDGPLQRCAVPGAALFPADTAGQLSASADWGPGLTISAAVGQGVWGFADSGADAYKAGGEEAPGMIGWIDIVAPAILNILQWPGAKNSDGSTASPFANSIDSSGKDGLLIGASQVNQGPEAGQDLVGLAGRQPGQGTGEPVHAQHLTVAAQRLVTGRGQPDQRPPPVGGIVLALEQPLAFQVGDDLADHRLRPAQVRRGLPHGERARQRQVLEHRPGRAGQLAPGSIPAVKRQVDGAEEVGEPFGVRPFVGHPIRVPACRSIVNPDGSGHRPFQAAGCGSRARSLG